jgi:hypothetical protein
MLSWQHCTLWCCWDATEEITVLVLQRGLRRGAHTTYECSCAIISACPKGKCLRYRCPLVNTKRHTSQSGAALSSYQG